MANLIDAQARAANMRRLKNDDTFQMVMKEVETAQASVFLDASSSVEEREEAHAIIRALSEIKGHLDSVIAEEKVLVKQDQKRKQHRGKRD